MLPCLVEWEDIVANGKIIIMMLRIPYREEDQVRLTKTAPLLFIDCNTAIQGVKVFMIWVVLLGACNTDPNQDQKFGQGSLIQGPCRGRGWGDLPSPADKTLTKTWHLQNFQCIYTSKTPHPSLWILTHFIPHISVALRRSCNYNQNLRRFQAEAFPIQVPSTTSHLFRTLTFNGSVLLVSSSLMQLSSGLQ